MLIILEGVDCTGKTTLARALADRYGLTYRHAGPPEDHPLIEYVAPLRGYDPAAPDGLVLDRWHLGEMCWPEIFGRGTEYDAAVHACVETFLASRGAVLVQCVGSAEDVERRVRSRGDAKLAPSDVPRALELFERAFAASRLLAWGHSIECPLDPDAVAAFARSAARRAAREREELTWRA